MRRKTRMTNDLISRQAIDCVMVNAGRGSANFCPNCGATMDERREDE